MKKINYHLVVLSFLLSTGCGTPKADTTTSSYGNNFESFGYWSDNPLITREAAHSGLFCTYTDPETIYSQTMVLHGKDIKNKDIKKLHASVWVMSPATDARAKLVLTLEDQGKNLIWEGVETQRFMRQANQWAAIELNVDLKEKISDNMVVKLYGLNDGSRRVYWDDFTFTME